MNKNLYIEIVSTTQPRMSSMSHTSRQSINYHLRRSYKNVRVTIINNSDDVNALIRRSPDLVFLGTSSIYAEANKTGVDDEIIWLSDIFEFSGIVCSGSPSSAHRLESEKADAKYRVQSVGLATSKYLVTRLGEKLKSTDIDFSYPLFIKPTDSAGGVGVDERSVAYTFADVEFKVNSIAQCFGFDSLIEQYLPGREFSVAILKIQSSLDYLIMPLELIAEKDINGDRMLSSKVKNADTEKVSIITDESIKSAVSILAINVFQSLGARDYGRVDIRLDDHGVPHFLEANLIPSIIENYGSFPKACNLNENLAYGEVIDIITDLALSRRIEEKNTNIIDNLLAQRIPALPTII